LFFEKVRKVGNFFIPSVKLIDKKRVGSKTIKVHDQACTPYQRLLASEHTHAQTKERLRTKFQSLNPFDIQTKMTTKIKQIMQLVYSKID